MSEEAGEERHPPNLFLGELGLDSEGGSLLSEFTVQNHQWDPAPAYLGTSGAQISALESGQAVKCHKGPESHLTTRCLAFLSQEPQFLYMKHKDSGALERGCQAAGICRLLKVGGPDSDGGQGQRGMYRASYLEGADRGRQALLKLSQPAHELNVHFVFKFSLTFI